MLRRYDVPLPEIRIRFRVYELYAENDEKLGIDFQSWKNNAGMELFSAGGRYRDNWAATYGGTMARPQGSERTSFYHFNPKWNTRYLDFLASRGKAGIAHSGEVTVRQNSTSTLERTTQLFSIDTTVPAPETEEQPDGSHAQIFDEILPAFGRELQETGIAVDKANQQTVTRDPNSYGFFMTVKALSIAPEAAILKLTLKNSSLIGYQSTGAPRIQEGNTVTTDVMVSTQRNRFVVGGWRNGRSSADRPASRFSKTSRCSATSSRSNRSRPANRRWFWSRNANTSSPTAPCRLRPQNNSKRSISRPPTPGRKISISTASTVSTAESAPIRTKNGGTGVFDSAVRSSPQRITPSLRGVSRRRVPCDVRPAA